MNNNLLWSRFLWHRACEREKWHTTYIRMCNINWRPFVWSTTEQVFCSWQVWWMVWGATAVDPPSHANISTPYPFLLSDSNTQNAAVMTLCDFAHSSTERRDHVERALWSLIEHCIAHITALLGRVVESHKNLDSGFSSEHPPSVRSWRRTTWSKHPAISCYTLIDSATYVYAHQDLIASCQNVAMSL